MQRIFSGGAARFELRAASCARTPRFELRAARFELRASSCALREDAALRAARFGRAPRCAHAECVVIVTRGALDVGSNGWRPLQ